MICLIPAGGGTPFFFTPLPEQVEVKYGAKYQTFDTISRGTVKVRAELMSRRFLGAENFSDSRAGMKPS